jgi:Flp pilus assembly protein TadG
VTLPDDKEGDMKSIKRGTKIDSERGTVAIVVAILLTVFIGFAALAVDVGYMMTARNELQNAADSAALAAARRIGYTYECGTGPTCVKMAYTQQLTYVFSRPVIVNVAQSVALSNKAAGLGIILDDADVAIGTWDNATKTLTATLTSPDAVRVTVRRDGTTNGPIGTFFARIWGTNTVNVRATATAALTGESTAAPGGLPVPLGISSFFFQHPEYCHDNITFYPSNTPDSCAGWHIYDQPINNANDRALRTTINDLRTGSYTSPEVFTSGDNQSQFKFTGGTMSQQTFDAMRALYDANKNALGEWLVTVPVYDASDCRNPNGTIGVVGFATAIITGVVGAPTNTIVGRVECDNTVSGRGGGGNYGTKGSIPGLVNWRDVEP